MNITYEKSIFQYVINVGSHMHFIMKSIAFFIVMIGYRSPSPLFITTLLNSDSFHGWGMGVLLNNTQDEKWKTEKTTP